MPWLDLLALAAGFFPRVDAGAAANHDFFHSSPGSDALSEGSPTTVRHTWLVRQIAGLRFTRWLCSLLLANLASLVLLNALRLRPVCLLAIYPAAVAGFRWWLGLLLVAGVYSSAFVLLPVPLLFAPELWLLARGAWRTRMVLPLAAAFSAPLFLYFGRAQHGTFR